MGKPAKKPVKKPGEGAGGRPPVFAVCGVKNSGKTTLIAGIIRELTAKGYRVATIKHDGHSFTPDVPGTDTDIHRRAGAFGTAVFDGHKWMAVKEEAVEVEELSSLFPEADLILAEGFKGSAYPKIEVVRAAVSQGCVSNRENLLAVATDLERPENLPEGVPLIGLSDAQAAAARILRQLEE